MSEIKNIAVIGAGPAGLIVASELKKQNFRLTVFEQRDCIGGTWAIQPLKTIPDCREGLERIYSATYPSLRCNLPKACMTLPDVRLPEGFREFSGHEEVLLYLKQFSEFHELTPHFRFNHVFKSISPAQTNGSVTRQWRVITEPENNQVFDGIVLCTSRYGTPVYPKTISGFDTFTGRLEHSLSYRGAEYYRDKRVALLGTGPSGEDLSREISTTANRVFLCAHKGSRALLLPEKGFYGPRKNITRHKNVVACSGSNLILENGHQLDNIDAFILCTGYKISDAGLSAFPPVDSYIETYQARPLYLNIFHPEYPELSVLGMDATGIPFVSYPFQAKAIVQQLQGKLSLPDYKQRLYAARQLQLRQIGRLGFSTKIKNGKQQIGKLARMTGYHPDIETAYEAAAKASRHRLMYPNTYRDEPFR